MSNLPHLTLLLDILSSHPEGLSPDELLSEMADRGTSISRPTLNRVLVQGREQGKLIAEGLTTGRTYRAVSEDEQSQITLTAAKVQAGQAQDIVSAYGSVVWSTADTLRGVGIKQSDWPKHMMPFFAVMLLESRVLRLRKQAMDDLFEGGKLFDRNNANHLSDLKDYYIANTPGTNNTWHEGLLLHGEGMDVLAKGGPSGIVANLNTYLSGFDANTQMLLGYGEQGHEKFLGITDTIKTLAAKGSGHLAQWAAQWARVRLEDFDSSDITTLEEHIKRKWADISADTSGEHFTPFDLFRLVAALAADHFERHPFPSDVLTVYDPTCGGGNMLFGVADWLAKSAKANGKTLFIKTLGQEINDTLFGLASVEARFRENADIRYGNTLTADQFPGEKFALIVANPPYGVDWKGVEKDIRNDASGRFPDTCRPPVSDGQHLFLQHVQSHMADHGLAFVFCSGSTLFSGDAGGGESNARMRYFHTDDDVWGIIQLPKDEFYNTGISTYLWIFKKNKPENMKGRAFFIDASDMATRMRKSLGSKRNELGEEAKQKIVDMVRTTEEKSDVLAGAVDPVTGTAVPSPRKEDGRRVHNVGLSEDLEIVDVSSRPATARLLDANEVSYNRLTLELTRGNPSFQDNLAFDDFVINIVNEKLSPQAAEEMGLRGEHNPSLTLENMMDLDDAIEAVAKFEVSTGQAQDLDDRIQDFQADPKTLVAAIKTLLLNRPVLVSGYRKVGKKPKVKDRPENEKKESFAWNFPGHQERELTQLGETVQVLGRAAPKVNIKIKSDKNTGTEMLTIDLSYSADTEKDTETVPYSSDPATNAMFEEFFLNKWVRENHTVLDRVAGCEVNFNRLFPKVGQRKTLAQVQAEIDELDKQLTALKVEGL